MTTLLKYAREFIANWFFFLFSILKNNNVVGF